MKTYIQADMFAVPEQRHEAADRSPAFKRAILLEACRDYAAAHPLQPFQLTDVLAYGGHRGLFGPSEGGPHMSALARQGHLQWTGRHIPSTDPAANGSIRKEWSWLG